MRNRTQIEYKKQKSIQLPLNAFFFLWRRVNGNGTGNNVFLSTELHYLGI